MTRTLLLGAALAFGLATAANAGIAPAPVGKTESLMSKVAEGCGRGFWRGPNGRCHPMFNGRACPPGYRSGPERKRCGPTSKGPKTSIERGGGQTGSAAFILWTRRERPTEEASRNRQSRRCLFKR